MFKTPLKNVGFLKLMFYAYFSISVNSEIGNASIKGPYMDEIRQDYASLTRFKRLIG